MEKVTFERLSELRNDAVVMQRKAELAVRQFEYELARFNLENVVPPGFALDFADGKVKRTGD